MKNVLIIIAGLALSGVCRAMETDSVCSIMSEMEISAEAVTAAVPDTVPDKWTYGDCVDWALANNTDIRRSLLSVLLADEDIASAKDAWLPEVSFTANHSFTNFPSPENNSQANVYNSSYGINAGWTVWEGNVRKYRLESARLIRDQQLLAGEDVAKNLKLAILQAYLDIMYSEEAVEIASRTLETSTSQFERAAKLTEAGRSSSVDLAQIESQMAQDRYGLVQAESNLATARMALKKILMLGLDSEIEIVSSGFTDEEVLALPPAKDEVFAAAVAWLPEFKSNRLSKEVYDYDIKIAKAGRLPKITLQGSVGTGYASGGRSWATQMGKAFNENVGVSLSIPIFDANATKRAVAKARLASLDYDLTDREQLENLAQTVESLYVESRNAREKYLAGIKQLEAAEATSALVDRQFELGLVNPLELLTAHNDLLNARLAQLQNKYMAILSGKTIGFYATSDVTMPGSAETDVINK